MQIYVYISAFCPAGTIWNNGDHVKEKLFQTVSESCQESTFQQLTQWSLAMAARALLML